MAKKIGKKPAASKSTTAVATPRPAAPRPATPRLAKPRLVKPRLAKSRPTTAKSPPARTPPKLAAKASPVKPVAKSAVAAKSHSRISAKPPIVKVTEVAAKVAAAVVKPVAVAAKSIAVAVKKPARPVKIVIPLAEKSTIVTAYAKVPGLNKPTAPALAVKKPVRPIDTRPVRLPPPPVTSNSKTAKNRAGLSAREIEHFRDQLLEKRRELLGDVSSMETSALRSGNSNLSTLPMHMADAGTDNYEQEFTLGLVEKDRQLMREINIALAKIQDGSYGICEGTGKPIAKPRLEAQPWARYSIEHARALEKPQFRRAF